jgi:peptidylprolyl isomerase domain and WD repeat-containing protein 1
LIVIFITSAFTASQAIIVMSEKQSLKRAAEPADDDSDDDFGPMPAAASSTAEVLPDVTDEKLVKKAKKILPFEKTYIDSLPSAALYERSFMHRDLVTHISVAKNSEFIITGSCDGHVKFWKKMPDNIEFVKHFQAHLGDAF